MNNTLNRRCAKALISIALLVLTSTFHPICASVSVDNLANFQVLQRNSETYSNVYVIGTYTASAPSRVQVCVVRQEQNDIVEGFNWITIATIASAKNWTGIIPKLPVGGEYSLMFRLIDQKNCVLDTFKTIEHVLVGDIWGAAGQSNMLGMGWGDKCDSAIDQVHCIASGTTWKKAREPLGGAGVGPALRFAIHLFKSTNIPVGIAYYAKGGTGMDYWSKGAEGYEKWTSVITNAGGVLRGVIWYQGERNMVGSDDEVTNFKALTTTFMKDIRRHVNNAALPWILAQISTIGDPVADSHAMLVRESQRDIPLEDPYAETITTIDLPRIDSYHFDTRRYQIIGDRFASAALYKAYGEKAKRDGPLFSNAHFVDNTKTMAVVSFHGLWGALSPEVGINGFYVLEKGNVTYPLSTTKHNDSAIALRFSRGISSDATVGYAYGYNPEHLNLSDSSQIPAQPFYNQPIFPSSDPDGKNADNKLKNGSTQANRSLELNVVENPWGLYSLMLISFPEVKNPFAKLSIYSAGGVCVRNIALQKGQDRCTISRRFLSPGCYIVRIQDGKSEGTNRIFWKFAGTK
jgi:hypothetical protein